jgi:hypothetical protein
MKSARLSLTFCALVLVSAGVWLATAQKSAAADTNRGKPLPSWERVNRAARENMRHGDPGAAGVLVDEVFADHGIDPAISAAAPSMKDRLVQAEVDFQNGKSKGVTEDKVAATVNQLADRFGAPAYAHTDVNEVKELRVRMLTLYPSMIGRGSAATRDDSKPHFESEMSPVEAFHVTATMATQKLFNPDFQLSQAERRDSSLQDRSGHLPRAKGNSHGERSQKMLEIVHRGITSMSATEVLDQCGHSLDLLGTN